MAACGGWQTDKVNTASLFQHSVRFNCNINVMEIAQKENKMNEKANRPKRFRQTTWEKRKRSARAGLITIWMEDALGLSIIH